MLRTCALYASLALGLPVLVAAADETALTIYSSAEPGAISPELYRPIPGGGVPDAMSVPGYALVRHERAVDLQSGRSTIRFTDVAALIDPTTVQFSSLTDAAGTRVLEQNFQFDLVGTQKLLTKYIDKQISVERSVGNQTSTLTGTLLSAVDGLVLRGADGQIHAIRDYGNIRFGELPGGLITRPTLIWDIAAKKAGSHRARVAYQTGGITWWADYNLIFSEGKDANSGALEVGAWVSIINQSGASYQDAKLKLIAGDVHRAEVPQQMQEIMVTAAKRGAAADRGFQEKAFFEFHLYTLGRRTTLPNNSTKQIELFDAARGVPARKVMVYYGQPQTYYGLNEPMTDRHLGTAMNRKVDAYLEFANAKESGLGIALPAGRVRVAQLDSADGSLEFIGEDIIDHTAKDEKVSVKLGSAFDVVGERKQVDFSLDTKAKWMEEEVEIKLRNHKESAVEVLVKEALYRWVQGKIVKSSHEYKAADSRTVNFPVKVAKDGEAVVRYRVRYSW